MSNHYCHKDERYIVYDARGIPLVTVCPKCRNEKLSVYRREVLDNPAYDADEQIEEEF